MYITVHVGRFVFQIGPDYHWPASYMYHIITSYPLALTCSQSSVSEDMTAQKKHVVAVSNVGGGQLPSEWHTIRAIFHNFADLPSERDDAVYSDSMECHGLDWRISLYPGGCVSSDEDGQYISVYLSCMSVMDAGKRVRTSFRSGVPSAGFNTRSQKSAVELVFDSGSSSKGWPHFAERSFVLDPEKKYLVDGNLTVDFDIKVWQDKPPAWSHTKTIGCDLLKLLDEADGSNAAVIFEVGKEESAGAQKKELFYAHRPILAARCPTLATMARGIWPRYANSDRRCRPRCVPNAPALHLWGRDSFQGYFEG